jgi:hypothetical protein
MYKRILLASLQSRTLAFALFARHKIPTARFIQASVRWNAAPD